MCKGPNAYTCTDPLCEGPETPDCVNKWVHARTWLMQRDELLDALAFVAENGSGSNVPEEWPVWAEERLTRLKARERE